MKERKWLSVNQAAQALGVNRETILKGIHSGKLPAYEIGFGDGDRRNRYKFDQDELENWLQSRRISGCENVVNI